MTDSAEKQTPPDAADVARRALILRFQFLHLVIAPPVDVIARLRPNWSEGERNQYFDSLDAGRVRMIEHLRTEGLWEDMSPSERELFERPVREITVKQRIVGSWRVESILCLAWALGLRDAIPSYDAKSDPEKILALLPTETAAFTRSARLRPASEIGEARDIAELWHWRSRTRQLEEQGYRPEPGIPELDAIVREATKHSAADGAIPQPIDGDFPTLGKAYRDLSPDEWALVRSITLERHFALNWLCGYAPGNEWDDTPTAT